MAKSGFGRRSGLCFGWTEPLLRSKDYARSLSGFFPSRGSKEEIFVSGVSYVIFAGARRTGGNCYG